VKSAEEPKPEAVSAEAEEPKKRRFFRRTKEDKKETK
jgi:hypothetical protein